jgi:ketosteroid isomerase-like protein
MGTKENGGIIREMYAELSKGNAQGFLNQLADDVRWTIIGSTTFSGTCNGKQELMTKVLGPLSAALDGGITALVDNVIAEGDYVVMQARGKAKTKAGPDYDNTYCHVFRFVNGKVQEVTEYLDTELVTKVLG